LFEFPPVVVTTENVTTELLDVANDLGISADALDFDLLSFDTYYKGTVDEEWLHLSGEDLLSVTTEIEIRSPHFMLRQEYEIEIRPFKPNPMFNLRFSIAADTYKSKIVAVIDPKSLIPLKQGVQQWIINAIRAKQLRYGLMIGLYEQNLEREINRLLLKIQKEGPLTSPYRLPIGEFFPPVPPVDDKLILHYKNLKKENSFIEGVKPGDLLLEYVFPKNGRDGRGCDGQHIEMPSPLTSHAGLVVIDDETIVSEQDEASVRFYARISGYLKRQKGLFTVSQELQIDTASFKRTGSIEAGIDKEISLKVKKKDLLDDSIGTGVNIDIQKLDVSGTVGANAKIQACELNIGAQTHKKSQINVTEIANVHLHRGNLKAKEANVDILETGKVEADTVRVKKMVGGEIIARNVEIELLYSNARITALESITIHKIEGEGNNLIIDPQSIEAYHAQLHELEEEFRSKTSHLQARSKEYIAKELSFKDKYSRIDQFRQRVMEARTKAVEPMKADVIRIQQHKIDLENLKLEEEKLSAANDELHQLQNRLDELYNADLHAIITHHSDYNGHTRVMFVDPKTSKEYAYTPNGKATHIRLRLVGDEKQIILES